MAVAAPTVTASPVSGFSLEAVQLLADLAANNDRG